MQKSHLTQAASAAPSPLRKLVVLDMNGVVCATDYDGEVYGPKGAGIPCDFMVKRKHVYVRPFLHTFLAHLFANYDVAMWTSNTPGYAIPIAKNTLGPYYRDLKFLWTSKECTERPSQTRGERAVITKNLNLISQRYGYRAKDIVLVDDTAEKKAGSEECGLIVVKTFVPTDPLPDSGVGLDVLDNELQHLKSRVDRHYGSPNTC